jgi:hypothetical protein
MPRLLRGGGRLLTGEPTDEGVTTMKAIHLLWQRVLSFCYSSGTPPTPSVSKRMTF